MKKIKVKNILSNNGNKIANQFIITDYKNNCEIFQSYKSIIAIKDLNNNKSVIINNIECNIGFKGSCITNPTSL